MEHYCEPHCIRALHAKAARQGIPLSGAFELSPACNLECRMCYVRQSPADMAGHARPAMTADRWLRLAEAACRAGMLSLLLTGGEPFLWPDFWTLYTRLSALGLLISINTNGTLLDEARVARLTQQPPTRLNLTLYGASDATYAALCGRSGMFSRVDRAIRLLQEAGIPVKLNCPVTPYNVGELTRLHAYAAERGLVLEFDSYLFPPTRRGPGPDGSGFRLSPEEAANSRLLCYRLQHSPAQYEALCRALAHRSAAARSSGGEGDRPRCRAGDTSFWVTWDGWLTPCGMMPAPRAELTGRPFQAAWQELREHTAALRLSAVCAACGNRPLCHVCAARALAETGHAGGVPQYLCEMVRAMREEAARPDDD